MNEQQLQEAFIQFLAQKTGAKSQQELETKLQQMGEEGIKQAWQEFLQIVQQQQVQAAKFGAKLNYIKSLRGQCPEGYELEYFKLGGSVHKKCKKCEQAKDANKKSNPIEEFKCGRKMKSKKTKKGELGLTFDDDMSSEIEGDDNNAKQRKKKRAKLKHVYFINQESGGEVNSTRNPKMFDKMTLAKCGAQLKEACKGIDMSKCGSKIKKKKK